MPGMTGIALANAARSEWPSLPVIIVTGYAELPDGSGSNQLAKPFLQEDLAAAIAAIKSLSAFQVENSLRLAG